MIRAVEKMVVWRVWEVMDVHNLGNANIVEIVGGEVFASRSLRGCQVLV